MPLVRLQALMGHASIDSTLRYMRHAPQEYLDEDSKAIANRMHAVAEEEARAVAAHKGLKHA